MDISLAGWRNIRHVKSANRNMCKLLLNMLVSGKGTMEPLVNGYNGAPPDPPPPAPAPKEVGPRSCKSRKLGQSSKEEMLV